MSLSLLWRIVQDHLIPADDLPVQTCFSATAATPNTLPSVTPPTQLRILTHNTWGLPITPYCAERNAALSTVFGDYDIVVLQEAVHLRELNDLIDAARECGLVYHHQYLQGIGFPTYRDIIGPGLLLLSRYPIRSVSYQRYSVNGKPQKFKHSDYFLAKGVAHAVIALADNVEVDVFTTHTHANYSGFVYDVDEQHGSQQYQELAQLIEQHHVDNDGIAAELLKQPFPFANEYQAHSVVQSYELAHYINTMRSPDRLCVLAGDLNAVSNDIFMQLLFAMTHLRDAQLATKPQSKHPNHTYACQHNTFSPFFTSIFKHAIPDPATAEKLHQHGGLTEQWTKQRGRAASSDGCELFLPTRIDYVLYDDKSHHFKLTDSHTVREYCDVDSQHLSVSDHHGVAAVFELTADTASSQAAKPHSANADQSQADDSNDRKQATGDGKHAVSSNTGDQHDDATLSKVLECCQLILFYGWVDATQRRHQHWHRMKRAALLVVAALTISPLHMLQLIQYAYSIRAVHTSTQPLFDSSLISTHASTYYITTALSFMLTAARCFLPVYAFTHFLLSQYAVRDEQQAIRHTLSRVYLDHQALQPRLSQSKDAVN